MAVTQISHQTWRIFSKAEGCCRLTFVFPPHTLFLVRLPQSRTYAVKGPPFVLHDLASLAKSEMWARKILKAASSSRLRHYDGNISDLQNLRAVPA